MRASVIREILLGLDDLRGDEDTKRQAKEVVRRIASTEGILAAEMVDRVGFAIALLDAREERTVIRNRIMARYGVKESTARRAISAALSLRQSRQKSHFFDALNGNTATSEIGESNDRIAAITES